MRAPLFVARCTGSIERDVLRSMCVGYRMMLNVLCAVRCAWCAQCAWCAMREEGEAGGQSLRVVPAGES